MPSSPSTTKDSRAKLPTLLIVLAGLALIAPSTARASESPWEAFDRLRTSLRAQSPLQAEFVQTYLPLGFEEGDREEGTLAISLPTCLRWDYGEPFPKSFLLCEKKLHHWTPGDPIGSRYLMTDEEAPGLDFFLQTSSQLRQRYNAAASERAGGTLQIELIPVEPSEDVARAEVVLDSKSRLILSLRYEDAEGNSTLFEITNYRSGAERGTFLPPPGMQWEDR